MATHSSVLAWKTPGTEEPGGLQSMRSQESDTTQQLNYHKVFQAWDTVLYFYPMICPAYPRLASCLPRQVPEKSLAHMPGFEKIAVLVLCIYLPFYFSNSMQLKKKLKQCILIKDSDFSYRKHYPVSQDIVSLNIIGTVASNNFLNSNCSNWLWNWTTWVCLLERNSPVNYNREAGHSDCHLVTPLGKKVKPYLR